MISQLQFWIISGGLKSIFPQLQFWIEMSCWGPRAQEHQTDHFSITILNRNEPLGPLSFGGLKPLLSQFQFWIDHGGLKPSSEASNRWFLNCNNEWKWFVGVPELWRLQGSRGIKSMLFQLHFWIEMSCWRSGALEASNRWFLNSE